MNAFIDEHRARCGVEPICTALQVAPSAYWRHAARQRNPVLLSARARRDASLLPQVQHRFSRAGLEEELSAAGLALRGIYPSRRYFGWLSDKWTVLAEKSGA